jgi:hypothetical protein
VSGIAVDPDDANHAWISYSGYDAYTPSTTGHVFEVRFTDGAGTATFQNLSYNLGDQPILDVVRDAGNGDLYVATDFGVLRLPSGSNTWVQAAAGMPTVAVYGLTIDASGTVMYAATHGRGIYRIALPGPPVALIAGADQIEIGKIGHYSGAASAAYDGGPVTFNWRLPGVKTRPTTMRVSYTPPSVGTKTLSLTVTDLDGRTSVATKDVEVVDTKAPVVRIKTPIRGQAGLRTRISVRVLDPGGLKTVGIDYGDKTKPGRVRVPKGGLARLSHVYAKRGTFTVKVLATDRAGHGTLKTAPARIGLRLPRMTHVAAFRTGRIVTVRLFVAERAKLLVEVRDARRRIIGTDRRSVRARGVVIDRVRVQLPRPLGRAWTVAIVGTNDGGMSRATKRFKP